MEKIGSLLASECFRRRPSFSRKRSEKFACVVIICHVAHGAEAGSVSHVYFQLAEDQRWTTEAVCWVFS